MWAVAKKDFKTLFFSPIGYIVISVFLVVMGIAMYLITVGSRSLDFNIVYEYVAKYGLPVITSVLTMRTFSEERSKNTETLLFATQKKITPIIIGKILSVFMVVVIAVAISLIYCLLFSSYGGINIKLLILTLFGFLLLALAYISVGVLISSLTESQVISAIITLIFLLLPTFFSYGNGVFLYLSLSNFFIKFSMGIFSINSMITLITFSIACVILTSLEMKRKKMLD